MTVRVTHSTVAGAVDSGDGKISSNAWNATHQLAGDANTIAGFDNLGSGQSVTVGAGLSYSGAALTGAQVATRSALAALTPVNGDARYLTESGREGTFVFSNANLATFVTADTQQGIYVAPSSDPSGVTGAWVRKFSGWHNVKWFGATGSGSPTNDAPAIQAAVNYLRSTALSGYGYGQGSSALFFPRGVYYLGSTSIDIYHALWMTGETPSGPGGAATVITVDDGHTALRLQADNTSGDSNTNVATGYPGAFQALVEKFHFQGGFNLSETSGHGVLLRVGAVVRDCNFYNFSGDGIHIEADTGVHQGNANGWRVDRCFIQNCLNGLYIQGGDTNAGRSSDINTKDNRQWGLWDSSFLGCVHIGGEHADNGYVKVNGAAEAYTPSMVSYNGNWYAVVGGQEGGASTNAPSGTTADNQWWLYVSAGAPNTTNWNVPAWVSGMTLRSGGWLRVNDPNAVSTFTGVYGEGGQGPAQTTRLVTFLNPIRGPRIIGGSVIQGDILGLSSFPNLVVESLLNSGIYTQFGSGDPNSDIAAAINIIHPTYGAQGIQWGWGSGGFLNSLLLYVARGIGAPAIEITGQVSTNPIGTGKCNFPNGFGLNSKKILSGTAAPTTGTYAQGDAVWNSAPVAAGVPGWVCVTGGTPGTWKAMAALAA